MINKRYLLVMTICLVLTTLAACTRPIGKAPSPIPSVAYTQAVQTVVAILTVTLAAPNQPAVTPTPVSTQAAESEPTDTPIQPSATPRPVSTATTAPSPVVTFDPSDPLAGLANPDWREGFDGTSAWYVFQDEFIRFQSIENKLEMTAFQANNRNGWALAPQLVSNRFYVEMTATFGDTCKGADHFGLMLSPVSSADRGYLFGVSCEGKYVLWMWDGTRMTSLVKWTKSEGILDGANKTNRIGILAEGNNLSLYANDSLLTELTDESYDLVYFGVFVGAAETPNFIVQVSSLSYWSLP